MSSGASTVSSSSSKSSKYGLFRKSNKGHNRNSSKRRGSKNQQQQQQQYGVIDNPTQQLLIHTTPDDHLFDSQSNNSSSSSNNNNGDRSQSRHRSRESFVNSSSSSSSGRNVVTTDVVTGGREVRVRERSESPHGRSRSSSRGGFIARIRSRSRSRSRSRRAGSADLLDDAGSVSSMDSSSSSGSSMLGGSGMIVTVTSCRSDAYHSQKAPGATTKVPRKAPSALKLFHELAVGVKDAYAAIGATPTRPDNTMMEGQTILWEFMGNLDFLLALVDEVATDTATRGALKDDAIFKSLRDVIKKCNKVLEGMLVRRERKYTLFFRLVQPTDDLKKIAAWNKRVEEAVGAVTSSSKNNNDTASEAGSDITSSSSGSGMFKRRRGRSLLPGAGKIRARRATPTPSLRSKFLSPSNNNNNNNNNNNSSSSNASSTNNNNNNNNSFSSAEDGFSTVTAPVTTSNLAKLQQVLNDSPSSNTNSSSTHPMLGAAAAHTNNNNNNNNNINNNGVVVQPKDELVDVIRGLQTEKLLKQSTDAANDDGSNTLGGANNNGMGSPSDLKPNWLPKADIPSAVPKLPVEYIHRHRLMKQVVNCLLDKSSPRDMDEFILNNNNSNHNNSNHNSNNLYNNGTNYIHDDYHLITSITSRHADKAGNGKTTLAVAAIQTVEIRERFCDGIAWLQLGRTPLTEKDIRRLYEELHHQLNFMDLHQNTTNNNNNNNTAMNHNSNASRKRFQGGELEGLKEDIGRKLKHRKVLICLDDVWRMEDAKWFLFSQTNSYNHNINSSNDNSEMDHKYPEDTPHRILMTTRTPTLLGTSSSGSLSQAQEVFVRIFSEHEAVKLLLSSAGRRVYGGKNSPVFHQARVIVKGCGNSPLALRLAGGMLRTSNRNWTLSSPTWCALVDQCRSNLEEASRIRSFVHSVGRIVDLIFATVPPELETRALLRKCFVTFAMVFHNNDWVLTGKGIPKGVILCLFRTIISTTIHTNTSTDERMRMLYSSSSSNNNNDSSSSLSADMLLDLLEHMNLLQRARHGANLYSLGYDDDNAKENMNSTNNNNNDTTNNNNSDHNNKLNTSADASERSICVDEDDVGTAENPSYLMHESVKYIAEEMATRTTPSFAPTADDYTTFLDQIEEELQMEVHMNPRSSGTWNNTKNNNISTSNYANDGWLSAAAKYIFQPSKGHDVREEGTPEYRFHELMVTSLLHQNNNTITSITDEDIGAMVVPLVQQTKPRRTNNNSNSNNDDRMEKYICAYLPTHFIRAKWYNSAGAILCDEDFIQRRVAALGSVEATRRQMLDLNDLRHNATKPSTTNTPTTTTSTANNDDDESSSLPQQNEDPLDMNVIKRDACRLIIDEVYRVMDVTAKHSNESLNMAICLSTVGEGLLKSKQPKDALLRLEEALGIYRPLLGPFHVDVARAMNSVAKALLKLGDTHNAYIQLEEASRIFDESDNSHHYDAISNGQTMTQLLVEMGKFDKAHAKYQDVLNRRKQVYGPHSFPVAKTINDYAVSLAKHARMDASLQQYTEARRIYHILQQQEQTSTNESNNITKYDFDITLVDLNIASIKSKKGDYKGAIEFYQKGVTGLKRHIEQEQKNNIDNNNLDQQKSHHNNNHHNTINNNTNENVKLSTQKRHLVSAIGRIGSLKMKLGDNAGALEAYLTLLHEVNEETSPSSSLMEKAKAHVKCATIYRQSSSPQDTNYHAISHLEKAFHMYTRLHGPNHKDTQAIASSLRQWKLQTPSTTTTNNNASSFSDNDDDNIHNNNDYDV